MDPKFVESVISDKAKDEVEDTACVRHVQYHSMEKLTADNQHDTIYVDPELDHTPYELASKYPMDKTVDSLSTLLVQHHQYPSHLAHEVAAHILAGKRVVQAGEFASLTVGDKKTTTFFVREGTTWVLDDTILRESFHYPTQQMFCESNPSCMSLPTVGPTLCASISSIRNRYIEQFRQRLEEEDQSKASFLQEQLQQSIHLGKQKRIYQELLSYKANNLHYEMGKQGTNVSSAMIPSTSPAGPILQKILVHQNEAERYQLIVDFQRKYTRPALVSLTTIEYEDNEKDKDKDKDESTHWLYCKTTTQPLLPTFVFLLASAYTQRGESAMTTLQDQMIVDSEYSEEMGAYMDKTTGWEICRRPFVEELAFDEQGRVVHTGEAMEPNQETIPTMDTLSPASKLVLQITETICQALGIHTEDVPDFILRWSHDVIASIENETQYVNIMKSKFVGKRIPPYEQFYHKHVILSVAATVLVCIQTAIPTLRRKKAKVCATPVSFDGYPLTDIDQLSGIQYLACVLASLKTATGLWNSVDTAKTTQQLLVSKVKQLYLRPEINKLYDQKKRKVVLIKETLVIPTVKIWNAFLPPLGPTQHKPLSNVTPEFHRGFLRMMAEGHVQQDYALGVYQGKLQQYNIAIIETIHEHVRKQPPLLTTSTLLPFVQNACCHPSFSGSTLQYFLQSCPPLSAYLTTSAQLSTVLSDVKQLNKAPLLSSRTSTKILRVDYPIAELKESLLDAVIAYLKMDHPDLPLPSSYVSLLQQKPVDYPMDGTPKEKREFIDHTFSARQIREIVKISRKENIIIHTLPVSMKIPWKNDDHDGDGDGDGVHEDEDKDDELWPFRSFIRQIILSLNDKMTYKRKGVRGNRKFPLADGQPTT